MRFLTICAFALALAGCNAGQNSQMSAATNVQIQERIAMARAKKITWAQAVRESNEMFRASNVVTPQIEANMAYSLATAVEVDAGRMTVETRDYLIASKRAEAVEVDTARANARRQAVANAFGQMSENAFANARANRPISCRSTTQGVYTTTNCD